MVVAKAAEAYLGETGLYLAGAVAGLTDVDAISLSMANLATANPESLKVAARTIVIAVVSNTLVKTGMAVFLGAPALRRTILLATLPLLIAAAVGSHGHPLREIGCNYAGGRVRCRAGWI